MKNNMYVEWLYNTIKSKNMNLYNVICIKLLNGREEEITTGHLLALYANAPVALQETLKTTFIVDLYFNNDKTSARSIFEAMFERLICEGVRINQRWKEKQ